MPIGKSLALSQNSFVEPPTREFEVEESASPTHARPKRQANLYDAVAGWSSLSYSDESKILRNQQAE